MRHFMLRIVQIEIGVHPFAAAHHVQMIHGAGKRHKDEKRGMVRANFVHEEFQVAANGVDGVKRKADDVADV